MYGITAGHMCTKIGAFLFRASKRIAPQAPLHKGTLPGDIHQGRQRLAPMMVQLYVNGSTEERAHTMLVTKSSHLNLPCTDIPDHLKVETRKEKNLQSIPSPLLTPTVTWSMYLNSPAIRVAFAHLWKNRVIQETLKAASRPFVIQLHFLPPLVYGRSC